MNYAAIVPIVNLLVLVWMLFRSRRWEGPAQSVRLEAIEDEQGILRGNLRRVERDLADWHRISNDCQHEILKELEGIRVNGAKEHPLREEIDGMKDRIDDLEQVIHGLPCSQQECPPKE